MDEHSSFTVYNHQQQRHLVFAARACGWTLDQVSVYADGTILSHLSRERRG